MIFALVVPVLALAASALGLTVTAPTNGTTWTGSASQVVTWSSVSTDPTSISIYLVNEANYPPYSEQLNALVQTSVGSINVSPPDSGSWPTGTGYQVNVVASTTAAILAQSQEFTITPGASSNTTSSMPPSTPSSMSSSTSSSSSPSGSPSPPAAPPPSSQSPSNANGAAASLGVQGFFYGLVGLLGIVLV